ncbi:MAG TPA: hypothetical protein ENH85_06915 [Candidatus Scalindua sp.]|nr:hypothetical protein [Candidatus Scalindua sp.]
MRDKVDLIMFLCTVGILIAYFISGMSKDFTAFLLILAAYVFYAMIHMGIYVDGLKKAKEGWEQSIKERQKCNKVLTRYSDSLEACQRNNADLIKLMDEFKEK